jgi:hypothetical protein
MFAGSNSACGSGPAGALTLAGPLHFRPDNPAGLTAIVPKYTMAAQAEKPGAFRKNHEKPRENRCFIFLDYYMQ